MKPFLIQRTPHAFLDQDAFEELSREAQFLWQLASGLGHTPEGEIAEIVSSFELWNAAQAHIQQCNDTPLSIEAFMQAADELRGVGAFTDGPRVFVQRQDPEQPGLQLWLGGLPVQGPVSSFRGLLEILSGMSFSVLPISLSSVTPTEEGGFTFRTALSEVTLSAEEVQTLQETLRGSLEQHRTQREQELHAIQVQSGSYFYLATGTVAYDDLPEHDFTVGVFRDFQKATAACTAHAQAHADELYGESEDIPAEHGTLPPLDFSPDDDFLAWGAHDGGGLWYLIRPLRLDQALG